MICGACYWPALCEVHFPSEVVAAVNKANDAANKNKDHADDKSDGNRQHSVRSKNQQCERNLLSFKLQEHYFFYNWQFFLFTLYEQTI